MTVQKIKNIEPRIASLLKEASHVKHVDDFKYDEFKTRLLPLVGWEAEKEEIRTDEAYVKTINALCDALRM